MHPNPAFRQTPRDANLALAAARGFGVLTANGPAGPLAAHVPFLLTAEGAGESAGTTVALHLARSNPLARLAGPVPACLIVSGPDAYVSPDWYGAEDQVPTWNYVAVHLRGTLTPLPDTALRPHLDALSARFEGDLLPKIPWTAGKMTPGAMERLMRMILPFALEVAQVDGTWKLNQNKTTAQREGVVAALRARAAGDGPQASGGARAIAGLMAGLD